MYRKLLRRPQKIHVKAMPFLAKTSLSNIIRAPGDRGAEEGSPGK